ncbi:Hypothetical predicted protein, partial [Marmota monax]
DSSAQLLKMRLPAQLLGLLLLWIPGEDRGDEDGKGGGGELTASYMIQWGHSDDPESCLSVTPGEPASITCRSSHASYQ